MTYTWMQLGWIFFIYSLVGWCAEVCAAAINRKKFINRGFVNCPLCPIYGFGAVLFAVFLPELTNNVLFLFIGGTVLATVLEFVTGLSMEKIFHKKLWDYSKHRFNLDGYICLRFSIIWGLLAILTMVFVNPLLCLLAGLVPYAVALIALWSMSILLVLDFITTAMAVLGMQVKAKQLAQLQEGMQITSRALENALTKKVQSRMLKSFPSIDLNTLVRDKAEKSRKEAKAKTFAPGCGFYKLVCLFFLGAFLGDITETLFCWATMGRLMSRSSVVYGPFSIVWGLACSMLTLLLYRLREKSLLYIFVAGTLLGGVYEYVCSVFTELVFGTIFWDYSGFALNLGGRVNLVYCMFWGVAAILWLKFIYPFLSGLVEKLPVRFGTVICNCLIVFMVFNVIISSMALARYTERNTQPEPGTVREEPGELQKSVNAFLDEHFTDERMERIYPNAKIVENMGKS